MASIKSLDSGRNNNFDLIRFLAATMVIFSHSFWLTGHLSAEPLRKFCGLVDFGSLALKIFFAVSGYLITRSLFRQPTLNRFVLARALRIFPGLIPAAVFCALVIGPLCTTLPLRRYLAHPDVLLFVWRMSTLQGNFYELPGVFTSNPGSGSVNVPLWTLPAELFMYFCILLIGAVLLLLKKQFKSLGLLPLTVIIYAACWGIPYLPHVGTYLSSWGVLFFGGMCCYVCRDKIRPSIPLLAVMTGCFLVLFHYRCPFIESIFDLVLLYGVLVFAYHPRLQLKGFHQLGDFSYGLYIYAFPVQQLLALKFPGLSVAGHFCCSFAVTLVLAALSWHFVEKPALALQSGKQDPAGIRPGGTVGKELTG